MYKKHKWFSGLRGICAFNQLRQICDLTDLFNILNLCQNANLAQCKLTGKSFEITYVSYTNRCSPLKMKQEKENDIELYKKQFKLSKQLLGERIEEIIFYLETTDVDFTEQPNDFGKSLLNGIDIKTSNLTFSVGNRFTNLEYGLHLDIGKTTDLEYFQDPKEPINFKTKILKEKVNELNIYWMTIPFENETGLYPQEIELKTDNGYFLLSSIEVNNGEVNTEFTNELLVIDKTENARNLKLGQFGLENGRLVFKDLNELKEKIKNGLQHGV